MPDVSRFFCLVHLIMRASIQINDPVTVAPLSKADHSDYATFLTQVDDALIYYSLQFRSLLEDLLQCESQYWIAREANRVTGVLPLMWKEGPLGRVVNSLPFFGSNGGVLATTTAAEQALSAKFNEIAISEHTAAATWISHPLKPASQEIAHDLDDERIAQFTPLGTPDELLERIDSSARRNIRKAKTSGIQVAIQNDRLDFLEQVHRENMAQIGGRAKPPGFFSKFPRHLEAGSDYRLYVAERMGRPVAALLLLYFNRTVEYYVPVTIESERVHQPTALILMNAMQEAAQAGYKLWNWGGTWLNQDGVLRFKRKWGAQDTRYCYYVKLNAPEMLKCSRSELLDTYPGFYVVPFDKLIQERNRS